MVSLLEHEKQADGSMGAVVSSKQVQDAHTASGIEWTAVKVKIQQQDRNSSVLGQDASRARHARTVLDYLSQPPSPQKQSKPSGHIKNKQS